jgi:hypothetical protein
MPIKVIARVMGCSKNTVKAALASDAPSACRRRPAGSIADAVDPADSGAVAGVSGDAGDGDRGADRLDPVVDGAQGPGCVSCGRCACRRTRASRASYVAGEIAQCDFWFPPTEAPVGFGRIRTAKRLPVLTMVTGCSRSLSGLLIPTHAAAGLFAGWWQLICCLGAVPRGAGLGRGGAVGRWRAGRSELTAERQGLRGCLAAKVIICRPRDSEAKGLIERAHDYLERSFLPGRGLASPADFNAELADWVEAASHRPRRALGCAPADRVAADREAMLALPPVAPATGWRTFTRLAGDRYVRLGGNDCSARPGVIGRRVAVLAGLSRVRVLCDGRAVAGHERVWARHQSIAGPEHAAAAKALRRERISVVRPAPEPEVAQRSLAGYDAALGLDRHAEGGVA